jgi:serine/threonine-protein kinase
MHACPKCQREFDDNRTTCPDDGAILVPDELSEFDRDLQRGDLVGEYVIEGKIGSGTFGSVYRAIQPLIGKQVAIKILGHRYSGDPTVVSRFIAEARAVNQIRHKNIIDIFSFGQLPDGRHFHMMELLTGTTLDLHLRERGRLALAEVILILRPLARALDAAHAAGIAHRDLKPANIFLARDDDGMPFPKLLDFGIAKLLSDDLPRQHTTGTGVAVGTPDYMSPEQCQGPEVDHRTDIYAFGVMTYQLLTGRLPFVGDNVVDVLVKQMTAFADPPSRICRDLPSSIDAPIMWMIEKDKEKRPPDLAAALGALEAAANASGFQLPPHSASSGELLPVGPIPSRLEAGAMLADPAFSATLPAELRHSVDRVRAPNPARPWWIAAVIAGVLGGGLLALALSERGAQVAAPIPVVDPVPVATVQKVSEAPAAMVTIEIKGLEGAKVAGPGGLILGTVPVSLSLPRGETPVALEISAPDHETLSLSVAPNQDRVILAELVKQPSTKKAAKKKKALHKKKAGLNDIESFE